MPTDAEMLARLGVLSRQREHWEVHLDDADIAAIAWAVKRIEELEGALRGTDYGPLKHNLAELLERAAECHEHLCRVQQSHSCLADPLRQEAANIRSALAPAPAKEGEPHA